MTRVTRNNQIKFSSHKVSHILAKLPLVNYIQQIPAFSQNKSHFEVRKQTYPNVFDAKNIEILLLRQAEPLIIFLGFGAKR